MNITFQTRSLLSSACRAGAALFIGALLATGSSPASAADLVWTGNDSLNTGNFSYTGNWQNNTLPSWGYANSLKFSQNQNSNVTTLIYDWGNWREVNDIFWDTSFPVSRTLSASSGGGINFKTRIENNSSYTQTVAMQVSGGLDGASDIQLNPVNGSLIISGTIFNDTSKDYVAWGSFSGTNTTTLTLNSALGPNATQSNVDFTVSAGRFSNVQVNASQVWGGTTSVNSGAFTTANGVTLASTAIVVAGGTVGSTSANTFADAATLTVNSGRLAIGGSDTVASLAGSGGTVDIAAGATLTAGNAGSTSYAGSITGSGGFSKVGSGTLQLAAANTYAGLTSVIDGELKLNGSIAGALNVAVIASLSGTGTVGGNATILGIHSPGNSPGIQTFNGDLTYGAGSTVNWELIANTTGTAGVSYDQIVIPTGNLAFSGSTTLALSFNGAGSTVSWSDSFWNVNRAWMIYDLSSGTTSNLSNLIVGGSLLDSANNPLSPTQRGYFTTSLSGQDVMLNFVAVPEPSTYCLAVAAAGLVALFRRCRNQTNSPLKDHHAYTATSTEPMTGS